MAAGRASRKGLSALDTLAATIVGCRRCPRLITYCRTIARVKRRAYQSQTYWGRPVPGFGDPAARVLVVGLAPGAHGANRTGRMFTGDGSGVTLLKALHRTGFASQPVSLSRDDGLRLTDLYLTAAIRCAPPANKPTSVEIATCRRYLLAELDLLRNVRVIVALGRIGHDAFLAAAQARGMLLPRPRPAFGHSREVILPWGDRSVTLLDCYHPSRQNTHTGRLTLGMLETIFRRAEKLAAVEPAWGCSRRDSTARGSRSAG